MRNYGLTIIWKTSVSMQPVVDNTLKMFISRAHRINWETKTPYAVDEGILLYKQGKKHNIYLALIIAYILTKYTYVKTLTDQCEYLE